jgi:hypothetical protein
LERLIEGRFQDGLFLDFPKSTQAFKDHFPVFGFLIRHMGFTPATLLQLVNNGKSSGQGCRRLLIQGCSDIKLLFIGPDIVFLINRPSKDAERFEVMP